MARRFGIGLALQVACGSLFFAALGQASPKGERLSVLAASSARPAACRASLQVWRRAQLPNGGNWCALLLRASARLVDDPTGARALAHEAAQMAPERAEPLVVEARSLLALGEFVQAAQRFTAAERLDPRAAESPIALLAAARVDVHVGAYEGALARYRRLIPRARLLADRREQQRALLEAALVAQLTSPQLLPEARAYASEARRHRDLYYTDLALALLALTLDREGRREEARAAAQEAGGPWILDWLFDLEPEPRGRRGELLPVWPLAEREALRAVLAEPVDRELARQAWRQYLDALGPSAPAHLVEHARQRAGAALFESEPDD